MIKVHQSWTYRGQSYRGYRNNTYFRSRGGYRTRICRFFRDYRENQENNGAFDNRIITTNAKFTLKEALIQELDESRTRKNAIKLQTLKKQDSLQTMIGDANLDNINSINTTLLHSWIVGHN
ncbi:hypothetical protein DPMN_056488 [Dreissena polymorpha]|uniref:Uncharacterized protein n=1 Tax=Dreissena polymorpha TaxID=45954 RepID=A0A9D4HV37_DREPO|nr:hypothetical protein DPMN_056488 [Dreissena polymorpha]